jgi:hypothetical protein
MVYEYYNQWHLGDCLWSVIFLRAIAQEHPDDTFLFYCSGQWHHELRDTIADIRNIELRLIEHVTPKALCTWIDARHNGCDRYWSHADDQLDIIAFLIRWFKILAQDSGLSSPIEKREDLLFDFPALRETAFLTWPQPADWFVVNSRPGSGQFDFDEDDIRDFIIRLRDAGYSVVTSNKSSVHQVPSCESSHMTVTEIARLALKCPYHAVIGTGPAWLTFNRVKKPEIRLVMLREVEINFGDNPPHFPSFSEAGKYLRRHARI